MLPAFKALSFSGGGIPFLITQRQNCSTVYIIHVVGRQFKYVTSDMCMWFGPIILLMPVERCNCLACCSVMASVLMNGLMI